MADSAFVRMLNDTREEIEGKMTLSDFIANRQDLEMMLRYHHQRRENVEDAPPIEYEFKLKDMAGRIKSIWMRVDLIAGSEKSVASLVDITSLKETRRMLVSSETRLSGILTAFGGYAYTVSKDLNLTSANDTLQEMIGRDCIGCKCHKVIFHLDKPCPWCNQAQVFKGDTVNQEFLNPVDDKWYLAVASPVYGACDTVAEYHSVIVDIHKRKQAEPALKEKEAHLERENLRLRAAIKERYRFDDIVGKSTAMQKIYELIVKAADIDTSVIIYGESGTGKELAARAIHKLSERGKFRFVPVNCATNQNMTQLVDQGRMREDFFYRIHIFPIYLPPLRQRREDIPLLVDHFLVKYGREEGVNTLRGHELEALMNHDWPGNVRELENVIQRYLSLNTLDFLNFHNSAVYTEADHGMPVTFRTDERPLRAAVQEFEKAYLFSLLNRYRWNRTRVAAILGIERKTLYLKLKKLGIDKAQSV